MFVGRVTETPETSQRFYRGDALNVLVYQNPKIFKFIRSVVKQQQQLKFNLVRIKLFEPSRTDPMLFVYKLSTEPLKI